DRLRDKARALPGLVGRDLVAEVTAAEPFTWKTGEWDLAKGYRPPPPARFNVVAFDAGIKFNILRQLRTAGCDVTVVPAGTPAEAGSRPTSTSTMERVRACATRSCPCSACSTIPRPRRVRTTRTTCSTASRI